MRNINLEGLAALAEAGEDTLPAPPPIGFVPPPPPPTVMAPAPLMGAYALPEPLGGASAMLEELTPLALRRVREILQNPVDLSDVKIANLVATTAHNVITATIKVDEGRLKARKLDILPKLLDIIASEEKRMGKLVEAA